MDPENRASEWFGVLCDRITSLCSEADDIIPQEPIEYVRNQLLTAGENIKQLYSDLMGDLYIWSSLDEDDPVSRNQSENTGLIARKTPNTVNEDGQEWILDAANSSSSPSLSAELNPPNDSVLAPPKLDEGGENIEKNEYDAHADSTVVQSSEFHSSENTEETINFADITKIKESNVPDDDVSSTASGWSTEAIQSNDSVGTGIESAVENLETELVETLSDSAHNVEGGAEDSHITEPGEDSAQLIEGQKLKENLILLDGDQGSSDADNEKDGEEEDYVSDPETDNNVTPLKNKKFAGKNSGEIITEGVKSETDESSEESVQEEEDCKELEILDEDDWEFV